MRTLKSLALVLLTGSGLFATAVLYADSANAAVALHSSSEETPVMQASGTFTVELKPLTFDGAAGDKQLGRLTLSKHFSGDLEADSAGEMLSAMTDTEGSAGYVAIERVTGALQGRKGSFVLQHSGAMNRGEPSLSVTVVPDSGTDELQGISGRMQIDIRDGQHFYTFEYTLPGSEVARDE